MTAICLLATIAVSPANAGPVTFAQYIQNNGATQQWSVTTSGGTTTVHASGAEFFTFSGVPGAPVGVVDASFTLTATSTSLGNCASVCASGEGYGQAGYAGTFAFTDTDAGANFNANLLSGTFAVTGSPALTGAQFLSNIGGSGGGFAASATAGNLNQLIFLSAFINFSGATEEDASWSLSSLIPNFALGAINGSFQALPAAGPFNASGTGTFAAANTPEPATLCLVGAALLGVGMLRRKRISKG